MAYQETSDEEAELDVMAEVAEVLAGTVDLLSWSDASAEYFGKRLENVEGNGEYLVLLHHQNRGLLELFGNVTSKHTTMRMVIEALHMLSEQWPAEDAPS